MLIVTKKALRRRLRGVRRRRPMSLASELAVGLAPPLVFATDDVVLAGMLEPAYDNGGDALDYAINERTSAPRRLRRDGARAGRRRRGGVRRVGVPPQPASPGTTCCRPTPRWTRPSEQFPERRFVTALIARLDIDSGRLTWVSAGHPPPLLIRNGRRARPLETRPAPPLGIDFHHTRRSCRASRSSRATRCCSTRTV